MVSGSVATKVESMAVLTVDLLVRMKVVQKVVYSVESSDFEKVVMLVEEKVEKMVHWMVLLKVEK